MSSLERWQRIAARVVRTKSRTELLYAEAQGYLPLREEIAHYLAACRGIAVSPGQILVLSSSQQALGLIAKLVASSGDLIAIEDPGYHGAQMAFRGAGATVTGGTCLASSPCTSTDSDPIVNESQDAVAVPVDSRTMLVLLALAMAGLAYRQMRSARR